MKITQSRENGESETVSFVDVALLMEKMRTETKQKPVSTFRYNLQFVLPGSRYQVANKQLKVETYPAKTGGECVRKPYGTAIQELRRYASFIGTSNQKDLLTDLSGSRRFICISKLHFMYICCHLAVTLLLLLKF